MTVPSRAQVATRFLAVVLPSQDVDAIVGDLEEEYASRAPSSPASTRWYWAQVIRSIPVLVLLPIRRSGWPSTLGIALAACVIQAVVELMTGYVVRALSPPDAQWASAVALAVTLTSLTLLSYGAANVRPGAAIALAGVAALALGIQLLLAAQSGRGMPLGTLVALVIVPTMALTGGFLSLRGRRPGTRHLG